jgi:hypothetical protein
MVTRDEELKWAYLLDPCFELTNSAGKPLTDGYIEVYIAGTRNKYYCASDFAGTLHPFQIPLDSLGSNIVLANPDNAYDVYVYNRYGNLIMSRYNVTPADGGAVISNTERINELEDTLVSAVTGLQGQIDDINETLENKKDKQEPYSVTLTPTQTVSAIIQNENGEMEVIYQEIDLPEEVPNVDIVSPASTLNITTHIDEETNTKTFSIDLSDLGHLEYGQYIATEDVITGANMYRIKGNLDTTLDGKIQLHKGNSYHITVRGAYVCTDINNSVNTLDYIEYSTFTPFHVDVDNTVTDPQNFEISYDIFKLSNDTDYYIAFAASAGKVSNLTVEIHSLSNLSVLDPDFKYQAGWGINIVSSVISVDQDIFNDYTTHTEVHEATVTAINFVTGAMPDTINLTAGQNIGIFEDNNTLTIAASGTDLSDYATHTEVYEATVTAIEYVTGAAPETIDLVAGQNIGIFDNGSTLTIAASGTDLTGYATESDVNSAIVTAINYVTGIIPDAQVQSNWEETDTSDPSYIQNKPNEYTVVAGQNIGISINGDDFIISASGTDLSDYTTFEDVISIVSGVTGLTEYGQFYATAVSGAAVMARTKGTIDVTNDGKIKLKKGSSYHVTVRGRYNQATPNNVYSSISYIEYITNNNININVDKSITESQFFEISYDLYKLNSDSNYYVFFSGLEGTVNDLFIEIHSLDGIGGNGTGPVTGGTEYDAGWGIQILNNVISVNPAIIPDISPLATKVELQDGLELVTGLIPTDFTTHTEVHDAIVTAVNTVTGLIPDAQVQSDWTQSDNTQVDYIKNKPTEYTVVAGQNIGITIDGNDFVISASATDLTGYATKTELDAVETEVQAVSAAIPELPDEEEVEFEEIDLTNYALASAIPTIQLNSNDQVTAIDNYAIAGGGAGTEYTAGEHIGIVNDEISVTGITELVAGNAITITTSGASAIISSTGEAQVQSDWNVTDSSSKAYIKNKPTIPAAQVQSNWNETNTSSKAYIQNKPTIPVYTGASGVVVNNNTITLDNPIGLVAGDNITIEVSGVSAIISAQGGGSTYSAGNGIDITNDVISIDNTVALKTDIPVVTGFATKSELETVSGMIPEEEEVEFEELDLSDYALASAIPDVSNLATKTELTTGLGTKQNTLTGITDVQVVQSLPASPVSSVLYLIPEV